MWSSQVVFVYIFPLAGVTELAVEVPIYSVCLSLISTNS